MKDYMTNLSAYAHLHQHQPLRPAMAWHEVPHRCRETSTLQTGKHMRAGSPHRPGTTVGCRWTSARLALHATGMSRSRLPSNTQSIRMLDEPAGKVRGLRHDCLQPSQHRCICCACCLIEEVKPTAKATAKACPCQNWCHSTAHGVQMTDAWFNLRQLTQ